MDAMMATSMSIKPFPHPPVRNDDYLSNNACQEQLHTALRQQHQRDDNGRNNGSATEATTTTIQHGHACMTMSATTQHYDCAVAVPQDCPPLVKRITTHSLFIKLIAN